MNRDLYEDEHRWFGESIDGFVQREIAPNRERFREQRSIDREVWLRAGEQGLLGLGVPVEHGGSGVDDFRFNAILGERLARAGVAYGSSIGIHTDVVAPYLIHLTDERQRERWLPRFCTGELVTAIAMTEPGAGSDLKAIRTTAVADGDGWVLNGTKTFITNGMAADLVLVAARTRDDDHDGISLLAVEAGTEGFERGRKLDKVGQPEADTAELFFSDARVPAESLIGELGGGFASMMRHLPQERLSSACLNLAHASHVLDLTLEYVRDRHAFGQPIGTFQNSRFVLADLATRIDVTRAFVDRCVAAHVARELSAVDAAKAKLVTSELQNEVVDACVQLHGGYGYMSEYEVARAWLDARVTRIWAGSNEIMLEVIGRSMGLREPA